MPTVPTQPDTNARLDELERVLAELRTTLEALADTARARRAGYLDCAGLVIRDRDGYERITLEVSSAGVATIAVRHSDDPDHGVRLVAGLDRESEGSPQALVELVGESSSNELNEHMGGLVEGLRAELGREVRTERLVVVDPSSGFERLRTHHVADGFELRVYADTRDCEEQAEASAFLVACEATDSPYAGLMCSARGDIVVDLSGADVAAFDEQSPRRATLDLIGEHDVVFDTSRRRPGVLDLGERIDRIETVLGQPVDELGR